MSRVQVVVEPRTGKARAETTRRKRSSLRLFFFLLLQVQPGDGAGRRFSFSLSSPSWLTVLSLFHTRRDVPPTATAQPATSFLHLRRRAPPLPRVGSSHWEQHRMRAFVLFQPLLFCSYRLLEFDFLFQRNARHEGGRELKRKSRVRTSCAPFSPGLARLVNTTFHRARHCRWVRDRVERCDSKQTEAWRSRRGGSRGKKKQSLFSPKRREKERSGADPRR